MKKFSVTKNSSFALSVLVLSLLTPLAASAADAPVPQAIASHQGPIRIAVIRNLGSDDNTAQFLAGTIQEGRKLGFQVSTFLSNGDDAKFQDFVSQAINQKYDGIILSQGRDPYATNLIKRIAQNHIPVSVFDTAVNETIPGVTVTQQDDASLTQASLGQLVKDTSGKANIIKLWVAGFPPMERRQVAYQNILKANPGIKELESVGAVSSDVQGDTANKIGALLAKYPKGQIDAIWGSWDAFSQGAYKALVENGRTEIKLYSIDTSNQDLQLMRQDGSPWKLSVAVDPKLIGAVNLRLIANKIAGEPTPATYEFKAANIPQSLVVSQSGPVNVAGLAKIIPGWGQSTDFVAPWFSTLAKQAAKQ
jgi:simple sugar transport system substrate-binding protein